MFVFDAEADQVVRLPVTTAAGGFTLLLRRPTFGEQMRDDQLCVRSGSRDRDGTAYAELMLYRSTFATGWEGVVDKDGKTIQFTLDAFQRLLATPGEVQQIICKGLSDLASGVDLGESKGTSAAGSPGVSAVTTSTSSPGSSDPLPSVES